MPGTSWVSRSLMMRDESCPVPHTCEMKRCHWMPGGRGGSSSGRPVRRERMTVVMA